MTYSIQEAKKDLNNISLSESLFKRMVKIASIITKLIDSKTNNLYDKPIIVGGLSVEIYTQSQYTTRDIDFVTSASTVVYDILDELGFVKDSRMYLYEPLEIYVDIADSAIDPLEGYDKINTLKIDDDNYIYVISPEDIVIDRTLDYSYADNERYVNLILLNRFEDMDIDYIRKILKREDFEALSVFNNWVQIIEQELSK